MSAEDFTEPSRVRPQRRLPSRRAALLVLAVGLWVGLWSLLPGCTLSRRPPDWPAVSRCLPPGVTLETEFCPDRDGCDPRGRITVKRRLEELGVRVEGGKLHDASGREVYFYQHPLSGPPPDPSEEARRRDELRQLKQRYTVVEMFPTIQGV